MWFISFCDMKDMGESEGTLNQVGPILPGYPVELLNGGK